MSKLSHILGIVSKIPDNFGGNINNQSPKKAQNGPFASFFFRKFLGETPPHILRENKKTLPSWALYDPLHLRWKFLAHHVYRQPEIWRQNYTQFFMRNQHELCKKGLRIHHLHQIFKKKKNRGNSKPEPPTLLREDKKIPLGLYMTSIEVWPLSVSDMFDVSGTYLKIIIEPNRIILKFRFATIQIRQKIRCL